MGIDFAQRAADNIDNLSDSELEAIYFNTKFRSKVISSFRNSYGYGTKLEPFIKEVEDFSIKKTTTEVLKTPSLLTQLENNNVIYTATNEEQLFGESLIKVVNSDLIDIIKKDNSLLFNLHYSEFEQLIADIFSKKKGFMDVYKTQSTGDKGVDVIAYFQNPLGTKTKIIVSCKNHRKDKAVHLDSIRALNSTQMAQNAPLALLATTGRFTSKIESFIREQILFGQMDLADSKKILEWINS